jgi:hypothetical protein
MLNIPFCYTDVKRKLMPLTQLLFDVYLTNLHITSTLIKSANIKQHVPHTALISFT